MRVCTFKLISTAINEKEKYTSEKLKEEEALLNIMTVLEVKQERSEKLLVRCCKMMVMLAMQQYWLYAN